MSDRLLPQDPTIRQMTKPLATRVQPLKQSKRGEGQLPIEEDCADSVQRAMSELLDRGFEAGELATAQLNLFSSYAAISMGSMRAAALLRERASELERQQFKPSRNL